MPAISQKNGKLNNLSGGKDHWTINVREATPDRWRTEKTAKSWIPRSRLSLKQQTDGSFRVYPSKDTDRPLHDEGTVLVDGKEVMSNLRFIPNQKGTGPVEHHAYHGQ